MAESSLRPKKKERWAMSSTGMIVPFVSGTTSYSRWMHVTRGGSRAFRSSLRHTGGTEGSCLPRAISPTAFMNWTRPAASLMVWFRRSANMNPPHLRRVTCTHFVNSRVFTMQNLIIFFNFLTFCPLFLTSCSTIIAVLCFFLYAIGYWQ